MNLLDRFYRPACEKKLHYGSFGGMGQFTRVYSGRPEEYFSEFSLFQGSDGYHLFYIKGDMKIAAGRFNMRAEQTFGHAVSKDLRTWQPRPDFLRAGAHAWDRTTIQAPRVVQQGNAYVCLYNGVGPQSESYLCAAVSTDLDHWTEHPANPLYTPDPAWSGWRSDERHRCGDPDVLKVGNEYVVYFTAERQNKRCVGCACSEDLIHWHDRGPALEVPCGLLQCRDCESPVAAERDGLYYLFYLNMGITWLAVSENPYRFETFMPWANVLGADVRRFGDDWYVASLPHAGLADPLKTLYHPDHKGLYLARLEWEDGFPFIRKLE